MFSRCKLKSLVKNADAHDEHQDLIDSNTCAFIHHVDAVEKTYDLLLVESRGSRPAPGPLAYPQLSDPSRCSGFSVAGGARQRVLFFCRL